MSDFALPPGRPALMGILNITPDSFSDGGVHFAAQDAIDSGFRMLDDGADILDVGGESTRPGAVPLPTEEELRRVRPVIEALVRRGATVSIDTRKPAVAEDALGMGAKIVNDVSGLRDPEMVAVCAKGKCKVGIMHMLGTPETMQLEPVYGDVVAEVRDYLVNQARLAESGGIAHGDIWIDPGIGFGKTVRHNLRLLNKLRVLVLTGYPVLIGVSRKSFLGKVASRGETLPADQRLEATLAAQTAVQLMGARIIRAHDVKAARRAIDTTAAIQREYK